MKISIITVSLNVQDTIEKTFLSVLNQTYSDWELVVIDGVSTDGTLGIIEKYKDNIAYFISEPDTGIYNAMNKGINVTTGDFILFLNANDTLYDNNVLQNVAKTLGKSHETKFLFGDVNYVSEDGAQSAIEKYDDVKNDIFFVNNNICHQSIFYHRSLFDEIGLYNEETYRVYADWEFNIKCLVQNKVRCQYLPITIADFQLGGLSANRKMASLYKKEKTLIQKRNFKEYFAINQANNFFKKTFGSIYKPILESKPVKMLINKYASRKKWALNKRES